MVSDRQLQRTLPEGKNDVQPPASSSSSAEQLLQKRRLIWTKKYGWMYDVYVEPPGASGLVAALSRLPSAVGGAFHNLQHSIAEAAKRLPLPPVPKGNQQNTTHTPPSANTQLTAVSPESHCPQQQKGS